MNFKDIKELAIYILSIGLTKGFYFLFPIAYAFFSRPNEYATYMMIFLTSQIIWPFLCFNFPSIIIRNYLSDRFFVTGLVSIFSIFGLVFLIALFFLSYGGFTGFYACSISMGISEALTQISLNYIRVVFGARGYLFSSLFRFFAVVISMAILEEQGNLSPNDVVNSFIVGGTFCSLLTLFIIRKNHNIVFFDKNIITRYFCDKLYFKFSISMIPYVFLLWMMSSFDKYVIEHYYGKVVMGDYAVAYSLSSVFLIYSSSVAMMIPLLYQSNMDKYSSDKVLRVYSFTTVMLYLCFVFSGLTIASYVERFSLIKDFGDIFFLASFSGLFISLYYPAFGYLFHNYKGFVVSLSTAFSTVIMIISCVFLVIKFGSLGAAYSTVLSYFTLYITTSFFVPSRFFLSSMPCFLIAIISYFFWRVNVY